MQADDRASQAKRDLLLLLYNNEQSSKRFSETQLSQIFGYSGALCGVILVATGLDNEISGTDWLLGALLILFGMFGAVFVYKANERIRRHSNRMEFLSKSFLSARESRDVFDVINDADKVHEDDFPRISRFRSHWSWIALSCGYSVFGLVVVWMSW